MRQLFRMVFAAVLGCGALPAFAQDRCSDVLVDGTFGSSSFKGSDFYQLAQYSRFARSSSTDRDRSIDSSATIPIKGVPVQGAFSQDDRRKRAEQVDRMMQSTLTTRQERDIASYHGDPAIIAAWQACMVQERAGLSIRFKQYDGSPTAALLFVEWFPAIGVNETRLTRDVVLPPGVTVLTGKEECLSKGSVIRAGIPCQVLMQLDSSTTAPILAATSEHGVADARLPARMRFKTTSRAVTFPADQLRTQLQPRLERDVAQAFPLSDEDIAEGWYIDPDSVSGSLQTTYGGNVGGRCNNWRITKDLYSVGFRYHAESSRNASVICKVAISARMVKDEFVPQ